MRRARHAAHRGDMNRYIIQRNLPGAGRLTPAELQAISQTSVGVLDELSPRAQWVQSFVTDDHIFCVYLADGEESIREHGRCGGFPVDAIHQVRAVIDPTTAE